MASAKIIVSVNGVSVREVELSGDHVTIGRYPHNDIVLEDRAVSGEHALITNGPNDNVLEDLASTNGTYLRGRKIRKHTLKNNDVIEIVKYRIHYFDAEHAANATIAPPITQTAMPTPSPESIPSKPLPPASLKILNGANAGKGMRISKDVTTLGKPGVQVVSIARRLNGYFISQAEGNPAKVNQSELSRVQMLKNMDVIDLSGTQLQFILEE